MAQKFSRPVVVFIDTPAAYPGHRVGGARRRRGDRLNLREMMMIEVPIIVIVCGEGGSGGALGIAIGDRVMMQEFSVYSVIPPEGCAAILWRDPAKKVEAATALKITAPDMVALGLVDDIIPEPPGGAHNDYDAATALVDQALSRVARRSVSALTVAERLDAALRQVPRDGRRGHRRLPTWPTNRHSMKTALLWNHLPCNDERGEGARRGAEPASRRRAAAVHARPRRSRSRPRGSSIPTMEHLHDPFLLADMGKAVERIERALAAKERIAIHGDYDVDGITSTVILRRALEMLGGDVVHFIPERLRDGYGLQPAAIERLHGEGVQLIISVDCGIRGDRSGAARARARRRSDHHRPSRARRHAAAGAGRDQPEAPRLHLSRTRTSPASASR